MKSNGYALAGSIAWRSSSAAVSWISRALGGVKVICLAKAARLSSRYFATVAIIRPPAALVNQKATLEQDKTNKRRSNDCKRVPGELDPPRAAGPVGMSPPNDALDLVYRRNPLGDEL